MWRTHWFESVSQGQYSKTILLCSFDSKEQFRFIQPCENLAMHIKTRCATRTVLWFSSCAWQSKRSTASILKNWSFSVFFISDRRSYIEFLEIGSRTEVLYSVNFKNSLVLNLERKPWLLIPGITLKGLEKGLLSFLFHFVSVRSRLK